MSSNATWVQLRPVAALGSSAGEAALPGKDTEPGSAAAAATLMAGMASIEADGAGGDGDSDGETLGVEGSKGTTTSITGVVTVGAGAGAANLTRIRPTAGRAGELEGEAAAELLKLARASPARMLIGSACGEWAAREGSSPLGPLGDATTGPPEPEPEPEPTVGEDRPAAPGEVDPGRGDERRLALPSSRRPGANDCSGEFCGREGPEPEPEPGTEPAGAWRCNESARVRSESTGVLLVAEWAALTPAPPPAPHRAMGRASEAWPLAVVLWRRECRSVVMALTAMPETPTAVPTEGTMLPRLGMGMTMLARGP